MILPIWLEDEHRASVVFSRSFHTRHFEQGMRTGKGKSRYG